MLGSLGVRHGHRSAFLLAGVMAVLVLGLASCAKEPVQEVDTARAALEAAKVAEASVYAPEDWRAAQDSLAAAEAEIDAQGGKFALFRSYGKAKEKLAIAERSAVEAKEAAIRNKEQMKQDAAAALDNARMTIADTRALLDSREVQALKRGKETRQALQQIESELNVADSTLVNVSDAMAREQYKQAFTMAQGIEQKVMTLKSEVQSALDKRAAIRGTGK